MLRSDYKRLCAVKLPYEGRQLYMHTFDLAKPVMQKGFEDYIVPVLGLIRAAGANEGTAHMTVDEKIILPGQSQRRPRPHVDGCFVPALNSWDRGSGWKHYCNDIGTGPVGRMPVIVAASVAGCVAWRGIFDAQPASDGDLSHISNMLTKGELLAPETGYLLSPDCVHESLTFYEPTQRTFLRIALPVEFQGV